MTSLRGLGVIGIILVAISAWLSQYTDLQHSQIIPGRKPPTDHFAETYFQNKDGLWIYFHIWPCVRENPKGVVVIIHGYGEHLHRFQHVARELTSDYTVAALDHQGFGRSEGDRAHVVSFQDYVDDVIQFLTKLESNHERIFLFGNSMGGLITIHTALQHNVDGVILCAPAIMVDPSKDTWYVRLVSTLLRKAVPKLPLISFPSHPSTSYKIAKEQATFDPLNYHGRVRVNQGLEILDATIRARNQAKEFKTPILILHGIHDKHTTIEGSQYFIKQIPINDKTLLENELRHESLQENHTTREPLIRDMKSWLEDHS